MLPRSVRGVPVATWAGFAVILLAGAALRFANLGFEGVWCDEGYSAFVIQKPFPDMIRWLTSNDDAPPLFYILEKLAVTLFGNSETGLRLLPAAAGVAAILLLLYRATRHGDHSRLWAAALFAVATYGIFYGRQARSYGLLLLLVLVLIENSQDLLLRNRRRAGPLLALSAILLFWTHHLGILVLLVSLILWPLRPPGGAPLRRWLVWHLMPLLLWACYWAAFSTQIAGHADGNAWMEMFWQERSILFAPLLSLSGFVPGLLSPAHLQIAFPVLGENLAAWRYISAGMALLCLAAIGRKSAVDTRQPFAGRAILMETAFLLGPLVALALLAALWNPTYVLGRTDAVAFPAAMLLLGRGLHRLPRGVALVALLIWTCLSVAALAPSYGLARQEQAKGTDRLVAHRLAAAGLQEHDWLIHSFLTSPSIEYYLDRLGKPHQREWFPELTWSNPAGVQETPLDSLPSYERQALHLRARIDETLPADGTTWIFALLRDDVPTGNLDRSGGPGRVSASELKFPTNLLVFYLVGDAPQEILLRYHQDWVSGRRVVLRVPRAAWVPVESLPRVVPTQSGSMEERGGRL